MTASASDKGDALRDDYRQMLGGLNPRSPARRGIPQGELLKEMWDSAKIDGRSKEYAQSFLSPDTSQPSGNFDRILENYAAEIEQTIIELGLRLRCRVLVAEYPTGLVNARVEVTSNGALVLVDFGLMMLVYQAAKVWAQMWNFERRDGRGLPILGSLAPAWPPERITFALAQIVAAYFVRGDSSRAARLPVQAGDRLWMQYQLYVAAEKFTLAHEYAHLLADHFHPKDDLSSEQSRRNEESIIDELAADQIALRILLAGPGTDNEAVRQFQVAGPVFLFELQRMLDQIGAVVFAREPKHETHPDPERRITSLLSHVEQRYGSALLRFVVPRCQEFFRAYTGPVQQCVAEWRAVNKLGEMMTAPVARIVVPR